MKRTFLALASALALLLVGFSAPSTAAAEPQTEEQKTLYALGMALATRIPSFDPSAEEISMITAGLSDGLKGVDSKVDMPTYVAKLDAFINERVQATAASERTAGDAFRAEAAKQEGAVELPSGMVYLEMTAGSGAQPGPTDTVKVHYKGTTRDGQVFDSSIERNEPAEFALNAVVPCFSEGLQKMKVGGKSKLVCPPDLAYGDRGQPGIRPGATLVFEVELLEIVGNSAATPAP
jgi:FKBP-type peptidyl-prolyl cis-trans isomerase FkpA